MTERNWPWPMVRVLRVGHTVSEYADGSWRCSCGVGSIPMHAQLTAHIEDAENTNG